MALKSFKTFLKEDYIPNHRHELNENIIDRIQGAADVVSGALSFVPGLNLVGSAIDAVSAGVDLAQGQYGDAALRGGAAALGLIPGVGAVAKIGGAAIKGAKVISTAGRMRGAASAAGAATKLGKAAPKSVLQLPGRFIQDVKGGVGAVKTGVSAVRSAPGKMSGQVVSKFKEMRAARQELKAGQQQRKSLEAASSAVQKLVRAGIKDPATIARAADMAGGKGTAKTLVALRKGAVTPGRGITPTKTATPFKDSSLDKRLLARGIDPAAETTAAGMARSRSRALSGKIRTVTGPKALGSAPVRNLRQSGVQMARQELRSRTGQQPVEPPSSRNDAPSAVLPQELQTRSLRTGGY